MKFDRDAWKTEMEAWLPILGREPIEVVANVDFSGIYDMRRCNVFKLSDICWATIVEEGCSCYNYSDAEITLYPTEERAMKAFDNWQNKQKSRGLNVNTEVDNHPPFPSRAWSPTNMSGGSW